MNVDVYVHVIVYVYVYVIVNANVCAIPKSIMNIEYISTLPVLRELYEKPRDINRFNWYVEQMTGVNEAGKRDIVMPIAAANPMGREHCLAAVNALLAFDADGVATAAAQEAERRLAQVEQRARVYISVIDDLKGGWTNHCFVEAKERLGDKENFRANQSRHLVGVFCWVSETYTAERVRMETLAAVYRYAQMQVHGVPVTLRQMMQLDGRARVFAGVTEPELAADDLAYTREVIAPFLDATEVPITFACLFGDEAARSCGYEPMGLSPYAGFALALAEALRETTKPEVHLNSGF